MAKQQRINNVTIEDARIIFRNFAGKEDRFNKAGSRNFAVVLDEGMADAMAADGWNVKYLNPREEGDLPTPYIQVKVSYKGRPPRIVMVTSRGRTQLGEDEVAALDFADISKVDLILNPYAYDVNGKQGISAYCQSLFATINEDELERKYADIPDADAQTPGDEF